MQKENTFLWIDLQLFAEGAAGGDGGTGSEGAKGETAAAAVPQSGEKKSSGAGEEAKPDRNAEFERLIKGDYKDLYDARVQDIVQKRLKNTKEAVDKYNALAPTLETLSRKYGVDASDIEALNRAIDNDNAYWEDEALDRGITVEQLKQIRKMERENAELRRKMEEQKRREEAEAVYKKWIEEAESVKQIYPNFNLEEEIRNPRFAELLQHNVNVRTAFEVMHKDEIIGGAMAYTAKETKAKITNSIMAGNRPVENGTGSQSTAVINRSVSSYSDKEIDDLINRSKKGEKIRL